MLNTISKNRINWVTSVFLFSTAAIALTCVPVYVWYFVLDAYLMGLFFAYFVATGLSITLGYHRLFSPLSFKAKWPVTLFVFL
ncbi:MAG TPA: acyl-CoA desaturase, partial [Opitutales bacterium]|nr:acyl-CoA desaturase [Opitutales bacterium]